MMHYPQSVHGIEALVLSLVMEISVLSVNVKRLFLSHTHPLCLVLSHILLRCHTQSYLHILGLREASNSCPLWKAIFYSCIFHIEFLSHPASAAAKCKHSWLFLENLPQYPAKNPLFSTDFIQLFRNTGKTVSKSINSSITPPHLSLRFNVLWMWMVI